jgi:primosomal protein N''
MVNLHTQEQVLWHLKEDNMEDHIRQNDKKIDELTDTVRQHLETSLTNRELEHYFKDIKITLDRIETQVLKTNGRVTLLEFWKENLMAKISIMALVVGGVWALIMKKI